MHLCNPIGTSLAPCTMHKAAVPYNLVSALDHAGMEPRIQDHGVHLTMHEWKTRGEMRISIRYQQIIKNNTILLFERFLTLTMILLTLTHVDI